MVRLLVGVLVVLLLASGAVAQQVKLRVFIGGSSART